MCDESPTIIAGLAPVSPEHVETRLWHFKTSRLLAFNITRLPDFIAISHVWAEQFFLDHVPPSNDCDGMRLVRAVLDSPSYEALNNIEYLWVDCWCIMQDNETDKNNQIPHMGRIYASAVATIIPTRETFHWSQNDWDEIVHIIKEEANQANIDYMSIFDALKTARQQLKLSDVTGYHLRQVPSLFNEIARLPWSQRIWTALEYVKSAHPIWVDDNQNTLDLTAQDMHCAFFTFLEWTERLGTRFLDEVAADRQIDATVFNNFRQLVQTKVTALESPSFMAQAISRASSKPQDVVYGLMTGTGVTVSPRSGETAVEAWDRWWLAATLQLGLPILFSGVICRDEGKGPQLLTSANEQRKCMKVVFNERCETLSTYPYLRCFPPRKFQYRNGSLIGEGQVAGKVTVLVHLKFGDNGFDLRHLHASLLGRFKAAFALCMIFGNKGTGHQTNCYDLARLLSSTSSLDNDTIPESTRTFRQHFLDALRGWKAYQLPHELYLCEITNSLTQTACLLRTGDEPPVGSLLALDFDVTLLNNSDMKYLLVVRGSTVGTSQVFHKVGLTSRVWFPVDHSSDQLRAIGGHRNDPGSRNFKIGGQDCESCKHPETIYSQEPYWEELRLRGSKDNVDRIKSWKRGSLATGWL